jgi:hypothetical protein
MKKIPLPEFEDAILNLEVDLKDRGGLHRFKKVGDLVAWLMEEIEFWKWIKEAPAWDHAQSLQTIHNRFFEFESSTNNELNQRRQTWNSHKNKIDELLSPENTDDFETVTSVRLAQYYTEADNLLDQLRDQLRRNFETHIINQGSHIPRTEPTAQFISEVASNDPVEAVFALDQLLKTNQGKNIRAAEINGRVLAMLFSRNLNRKLRPDNAAFKKATESWSNELKNYKADYEQLKSDFEEISESNKKTDTAWVERTVKMEQRFKEQIEKNDQDLANLKDTYESHMVLQGPFEYWSSKCEEHGDLVKKFRNWLVGGSIVGAAAVGITAYCILPGHYPSDSIPWRHLGLFLLATTFVLWILRLLVKLLLSNVHLYADAKERIVMIQTFMALVRHKETLEGLKKEDIALVLAPIFKPSTTGVIKDDGGPITLGDFISRLGGKQ